MKTTVTLLTISLLFLLSSATQAADLPKKTLAVNGTERSYYEYRPASFRAGAPLLLILHGGGKGDGTTPAKYLGFNKLADQHGFLAIYPNGLNEYWHDGRGYTHRGENQGDVDDVGYIEQLVDHLIESEKVDASRIYLTGVSNGGMMTLRLGCELSHTLAAIAPVVANLPAKLDCQPTNSLPVVLINGTKDPLVPYNGGQVRFLRRTMGEVISTQSTINFWAQHNGCDSTATTEKLPDIDRRDGSTVNVSRYSNAQNSCHVALYTVEGGGHSLPGSDTPNRPRISGRKNMDFDGAEVIWNFVSQHRR